MKREAAGSHGRAHERSAEDDRQDIRRVAQGGLAFGAGTAVGALLSVPAVALLVRSLGTSAYGSLAFALGLIGLATTLADLGLANGVTRMSAYDENAGGARWARSGLALATVSGSIATLACIGVALTMSGPTRDVLLVASPLPLVVTVRSILAAYLRTRRRIALVEGSYATGQILYYGGAMALVGLGLATAPSVAIWRVLVFTFVLLLLIPTWRYLAASSARQPGTWRPLLRFSAPLLIAGVAWVALQTSDVIMLGVISGPSEVGLYSPILQAVDLITLILYVLGAYFLPTASSILAGGDAPRLRSLYSTVTKWGLVLAAPLLCALIVAPGPLLQALFGSQYGGQEASDIARILSVGYAVTVFTGPNGLALMALGRSRAIAIRSSIALAVNVGANIVLISHFGAVGAAIGTSIVYVALNVTNSLLIWNTATLHPIRRDFIFVLGTLALLTGTSFLIVDLLQWQDSLTGPVFTGLFVGIGSLVAWAMTSSVEERHVLLAQVTRRRHLAT